MSTIYIIGLFLTLTLLAAQCGAPPTPPLPVTPAGPTIPIALLVPNSGELATFGRMAQNGSLMAFDEWNNRGGVLGYRLEETIYGADCDFESGRQAAQKAMAAGQRFIVGPLCSEAAIGAATVITPGQVLLMAPAATHPLVTVDGQGQTRPTVFRTSYVWQWQARAMAGFAYNTLKVKQAAILTNPTDDYAAALVETFTQVFVDRGGQIVYQAAYTANDAELADMLNAINRAGAGAIYLPAGAATVNRVAGQLEKLQFDPKLTLLGSDSWESAELDLARAAGSYFPAHFALDAPWPAAQTWAAAYKATYAVEPTTLAALSYDAVNLLAAAINRTGTLEPTSIAQTLAQERFEGVTGAINYDSQHNPNKPVSIMYIDHGKIIWAAVVSP